MTFGIRLRDSCADEQLLRVLTPLSLWGGGRGMGFFAFPFAPARKCCPHASETLPRRYVLTRG
jgi:hypothetical protein